MEQIIKNTWVDYFFLILILGLTGFEFFFRMPFIGYLTILFFTLFYFYFIKKGRIKTSLFFFPFILFIPYILQGLYYDELYLGFSNFVGIYVKFLLVCICCYSLERNFNYIFINLMFFLSLVSFVFFPTQFFLPIQESIKLFVNSYLTSFGTDSIPEGYKSTSLIIFNYIHSYGHSVDSVELRNSGPFWEPGLFGFFLCIALYFNCFILNKSLLNIKNIIFILAIITTLSITSYLGLFFILILLYFLKLKKNKSLIFLFPFVLIFTFFLYFTVWNYDFLSGKLSRNIENLDSRQSRIGSMIYHMTSLSMNPYAGVAIFAAVNEFDLSYDEKIRSVSSNGLSIVFFTLGIPFGILFYFFLIGGFYNYFFIYMQNNPNRKFLTFSFVVLFLCLSFSQDVSFRLFSLYFVALSRI